MSYAGVKIRWMAREKELCVMADPRKDMKLEY